MDQPLFTGLASAAMVAKRKSGKAAQDAAEAYSELEPVAALVDNVNDDFSVAVAEAIDLILSQEEFQDILTADPIGISRDAGCCRDGSWLQGTGRGLNSGLT